MVVRLIEPRVDVRIYIVQLAASTVQPIGGSDEPGEYDPGAECADCHPGGSDQERMQLSVCGEFYFVPGEADKQQRDCGE